MLEERMNAAHKAMSDAQLAANGEDKSSAGDKYETSRAMGHLDRDMNARQLAAAQNELNTLNKIKMDQLFHTVQSGSMIETDAGIFFIAAAIGKINMNETVYMVLSPEAPLARIMNGKKVSETFMFNQKKVEILRIA